MRITLITMPWQSLECPSVALGILHERILHSAPTHAVTQVYGNVRWAEYLLAATEGRLSPIHYSNIADNGFFCGLGDWVFAASLHGTPTWMADSYAQYVSGRGIDLAVAAEMQRRAPVFIDLLADEVVASGAELVGFTTTFMQNVPSLALARALKARRPDIQIVFGGANCDAIQGIALHRNFPFVDFVVRGEGEEALPELIDALERGAPLESIGGLCWRAHERNVVNPERTRVVPMDEVPAPNYDSYFALVESSPVSDFIDPRLVLEGARGCWWGEKHQCTFCGLNGSTMKFRSKSPERLWSEISTLIERHRALDVLMVENIIEQRYYDQLLPRLAASNWDLRVHYEIKSNLTRKQIAALEAAGVVHVQPGIENLSSRVLQLMDKGVNGCQNVQALRDCDAHGLTVSWNYLYGFPGESASDYEPVLAQMAALVHLQPPRVATRIALERFSPYFENPALGFAFRAPARFYNYIYSLPSVELADLVYLFDTTDAGISGDLETQLAEAIGEWQRYHLQSRLTAELEPGRIIIDDQRVGWPAQRHVIDQPALMRLFLALDRARTLDAATAILDRAGEPLSVPTILSQLRDWRQLGLVFEEGGRFVALPTRAARPIVRLPDAGSYVQPRQENRA